MTLTELCEQLHAAGVAAVAVTYSGSGDEGNIDDVTASGPLSAGGESGPEVDLSDTLHDLVRDWVYDTLEGKQPGWEINDGSQGTAVIDVAARTAQFDHANLEPVAAPFTLTAADDSGEDEDEDETPSTPARS
jgi:hypothetical protein